MRLSSFASRPHFGMDANRTPSPPSSSESEKGPATPPNKELPRDQYGREMPADYFKPPLGTKKSIEEFNQQCIEAAKGTRLGRGFISNRPGAKQPDGTIKR